MKNSYFNLNSHYHCYFVRKTFYKHCSESFILYASSIITVIWKQTFDDPNVFSTHILLLFVLGNRVETTGFVPSLNILNFQEDNFKDLKCL